MKIPKEIVEKMEQVNLLMNEVDKWLYENANIEGSIHDHEHGGVYDYSDWYTFRDEPTGEEQNGGEYCDQRHDGEDGWIGKYYYPTEKGKYFMFEFWL